MSRLGGSSRRPVRSERGSGTVLTAIIVMFVVGATFVGVWIVGWLVSIQRAGRAADLASLAGASAHVHGKDECAAARAIARENGGEVTSCEVTGDARDFVVRVEVRSELRPHVTGGPKWAVRDAVAGSMPR